MNESYTIAPLSSAGWEKLKSRIAQLNTLLETERAGSSNYVQYQKELSFLNEVLALYNDILDNLILIDKLEKELAGDCGDMRELLEEEVSELKKKIESLNNEVETAIFPVDKENSLSAFLEIRAGTGGLEASLFAKDLVRMYTVYSQRMGWQFSYVDIAETEVGGIREIVLHIEGKGVFEALKNESGVHRVQRVPNTETQGRVHTSTATVAVLPEVDEVDSSIDTKDLRIDTYRASGAGGQHVNKTDSAVRITHLPTGLVVACQDERSQHKNKAKAMKVLQARLHAAQKEKQHNEVSEMRKKMVASADRSDKIRTYNYPQNRVTDHRIGLTINRLEYIVNEGELDDFVDALKNSTHKNRSIHPLFEQYLEQ